MVEPKVFYVIFYVWRKTNDSTWSYKQAIYHKHPLQWLLEVREDSINEEYHILSYNEIDKDTWMYMKDQFD